MKKIISICLILLSVVSLTAFATSAVSTPPKNTEPPVSYNVRFGFKHLDGSLSTTGYTDSPGFTATNTNTGSDFECQLGSSPLGVYLPYQLPGTINNLPAGTYEFNVLRGQGNWTGYGNVIATLSPEMIGPDGYVTIYIPIAWEE
ncbi:hypothetical protein [Pedobacter lusitanus]|uniref:hypothetical protein n=1 Tax=Pedobacter lusitanus TaxID=1503925 RepID=UPI000AFB3ECC|nr:hypothetical protein [Pedobacter lusitanus]